MDCLFTHVVAFSVSEPFNALLSAIPTYSTMHLFFQIYMDPTPDKAWSCMRGIVANELLIPSRQLIQTREIFEVCTYVVCEDGSNGANLRILGIIE